MTDCKHEILLEYADGSRACLCDLGLTASQLSIGSGVVAEHLRKLEGVERVINRGQTVGEGKP